MPKFSGPAHTNRPPVGPLSTVYPDGTTFYTHEGGVAHALDARSELFTLAVTNMVGEATFYESAPDRDKRYVELIQRVTAGTGGDPDSLPWMVNFIRWLRNTANMRSASVVAAVEFARCPEVKGTPFGRHALVAACARADEPAEALGYFLARYGRQLPMAVKRGIADAAVKLYNERSALRYDGGSRAIRMADVIELTHPKPRDAVQARLFKYLLDKRHDHLTDGSVQGLPILGASSWMESIEPEARRDWLREYGTPGLNAAGTSWERLSGWLPGGMDAEAWESIIPSMGYMALLRNLRNFDEAKVNDALLDTVATKLKDPEEVAKSRQFPFRFFSAYREVGDRWTHPLAVALDHSVSNIPKLFGRTLILIDTSGSMQNPLSGNSKVLRHDAAALFAAAMYRANEADVAMFASQVMFVEPPPSVLRTVEAVSRSIGVVGHGTEIWPAVAATFDPAKHDRVVIFTDEQAHPSRYSEQVVPPKVPVYVWNLAGYGRSTIDTTTPGRYLLGGFTDASFQLVKLLEDGRNARWPWEATSA